MDKMVDFYRGKKVFVTGHNGFKGSWLCAVLNLMGAEVFGYSLPLDKNAKLYNVLELNKSIKSVDADIRDLDRLKLEMSSFSPDIVLHLAAQPLVRESYVYPVETYSTNVMGTVNVLEAARKVDSIRSLVNITTDKVYYNDERATGFKEDEKLCGYDPYSNSKSCSELVTYSYVKSFFEVEGKTAVSTARSGNVIGGGDFNKDRIIPDCYRAAEAGVPVIIRNPNSVRPYQHVLDCLNGYLILAMKQYEKKYIGNYNFGPKESESVTTGNLVKMFDKYWGGMPFTIQNDGGPHEANYLRLDCEKATKALDWHSVWDTENAVKMTAQWYKAFILGQNMVEVTDQQIKEFFNGQSTTR